MSKTVQLALAGAAAAAVAFGFARYGYGLFVPTFREEFGLSTGAVGLVSSAGYATYFPAMAATGFLSVRVGPRFPVVAGAVCAGLGMLLISTAQGPPALIAGVMLAGASPALCVAPFADAVAMMVREGRRDRVLSAVSSGTTLGLVVAGPVVLLTATGGSADGPGWRYALAAFAAAALLVAFWNARLLPNGPYREATAGAEGGEGIGLGWLLRRGSAPLLGLAFVYGATGAFYFTYAVDLARQAGLGGAWGPIMWGLVGLAGATGALTGDAAARFGLGRSLAACLLVLAASVGALGLAGGSGPLVAACALAFGASYFPVAALLLIWSGGVFRERPTAGFSAVLSFLALGSVAGPAALGAVAGPLGLRAAFWCAAALTVLSIVLGPGAEPAAGADNDGE